jgi:trimeric autotransporter adhesin
MKKAMVILVSFVCVTGACGAVVQDEEEDQIMVNSTRGSEMVENNHQDDVLSNPETSGAARAGGNTAIINQSGYRNTSSVVQMGDDNLADQTQTGEYNDLRVEQTGEHNHSSETQIGDHNRKVIIQNGTETIIEQVKP